MRIAVFALCVAAGFVALPAVAQRSSMTHKTVVVRQIAQNQTCASNCQTKEAFITIPHAVGDMLKGGIGARQVHDTPIDGIPAFPRKTSWAGANENDLAREFDTFFLANLPTYAAAMTSWQTQYGLATASHDIIQRVTHRAREKRIIINLITFDNGTNYYNGARVMPEDANAVAQILYVRAIPSAVTPGLPTTWNWASPGNIQYEMRSPTFSAGSGFTTTSVGATYDEPFDYSGTPYDPDARLKCLADKTTVGCGQAQPDVKSLIGTNDATYAVVDYYRRIKPTGVPFGTGFASQITASVTDRVATFACPSDNNGTYSQVFRFTMSVDQQIDRYLVFPDGRYYFLQTFRDVVTPAQAAVAGSSPITRNGEYPNLASRFLHHLNNAYTGQSAYAPNTVALGAVTLNQPASCGCPPQSPFSETRSCAEINGGWIGNFIRSYTYNAAACSWSFVDNTSGCSVAPVDVCNNIPGVQTSPPAGTIPSGGACFCTSGRIWDNGSMSCQCPSGTVWNGGMCVFVTDECPRMNGVLDPTIQASIPVGMSRINGDNCISGDRNSQVGWTWMGCEMAWPDFNGGAGQVTVMSEGYYDIFQYTRKEDRFGFYWGMPSPRVGGTPVRPCVMFMTVDMPGAW